jgi:hypothetical protein
VLGVHRFESHLPMERLVEPDVDLAHTTSAQNPLDSNASDAPPDERRRRRLSL